MKCPRCDHNLAPGARTCIFCGAHLVVAEKPTRPDEEKGWAIRRFGSIAGRAGSVAFLVHAGLAIAGALAAAPDALAFLVNRTAPGDLGLAEAILQVAYTIDLVAAGLLAVAFVALGAGTVLLRRRDPFTEEEVRVPLHTAAFAKIAGLLMFAWLLTTVAWRFLLPLRLGTPIGAILVDFATATSTVPPPDLALLASLWIVASALFLASAVLFSVFTARLPRKVVSPRSPRVRAWIGFAIVSIVLTLGVAAFLGGWVPYVGAETVYLSFFATKVLVLPILALPVYVSLTLRLGALGNLSLLVPIVKAIPGEKPKEKAEASHEAPGAEAPRRPVEPELTEVPEGIERISMGKEVEKPPPPE